MSQQKNIRSSKSSPFGGGGGLVIIDYGAGNIQSIKFAFKRLGYEAVLSNDVHEIQSANKVIFPGVGEASTAMNKLRASGLNRIIPELKQPVLGICLGMQLMCSGLEEGNTKGLGIFDTDVVRFDGELKVPQMGWNQIANLKSGLFKGVKENAHVYMVHSYYVDVCDESISETEYGVRYSSAVEKDNFYGTQFHPEKSGSVGQRILMNFLNF